MEKFQVHYWDTAGQPQVAVVEGEDGAEAASSIDDFGRLGYILSEGPVEGESDESTEDAAIPASSSDAKTEPEEV